MTEESRRRRNLGRRGERLARRYLKKAGYRYVTSNYATGRGEVDLIVRKGETLVFVEVKTREQEWFSPSEAVVNYHKQCRISAAARHFICVHKLDDCPCRFDVVVVVMDAGKGEASIRHHESAFGLR